MKRLLIVSYYFPPDGGPGTQRAVKFCRYLPDHGWQPTVLTRAEPGRRGAWDPEDRTLLAEVGDGCHVERIAARARSGRSGRRRSCVDGPAFAAWVDAAIPAAERLIRTRSIDAVLVTMSPFDLSRFVPAMHERCSAPVLLDLRDPWALDGWREYKSEHDWARDMALMSRSLVAADGVVANTPEARAAMLRTIPELDAARVRVITNGYDAADFAPQRARPAPACRRGFTFLHAGSLHSRHLYGHRGILGRMRKRRRYACRRLDRSGRTLAHLLAAVTQLKRAGHPAASEFRLSLLGQTDAATLRCVRESGVADLVDVVGYLPHGETVRALCAADALFLPLHGLEPGERSLIVPGKTYEYLAARRPILACLPPGDALDLVRASGRGAGADPCDATSIAEAMVRLHQDWRRGADEEIGPSPWLRRFERKNLAGALATFLDRVVADMTPADESGAARAAPPRLAA